MKDKEYYYEDNFECTCHGNDHRLFINLFKFDKEDSPMLSIEMFIDNYTSIFKRISEAIKYILKIGKYRLISTNEFIINTNNEKEADGIIAMLTKYKDEMNKWREERKQGKNDVM